MSKNTERNISMNVLFPTKKGKDGKYLCRYCEGEVKPPRRTWCSQECVDAALLKTDYKTKKKFVYKRDEGICQICSVDLTEIKKAYSAAKRSIEKEYKARMEELSSWRYAQLRAIEQRKKELLPKGRETFWDMDHVVPLIEGGSDDVENLRVLCIPCHKTETSKLAKRRARKKNKE